MVWKYGEKVSCHHILTVICLTGSEKTGFTDGRWTDARVTTVALLCSSTKQS